MNELMNLGTGSTKQTITSREIAELTGKRHDHVIRDIKTLNNFNTENSRPQVSVGVYKDSNNQERPLFNLTKRQSLDLCMGYSLGLRIAVTDRWEELEKTQTPTLPTTYLEALKELVVVIEEKDKALVQIKEDAPKVAFANLIGDTSDAIDMGTFAKLVFEEIKLGRNKLFAKLRDMNILGYKNEPYQRFITNGTFKITESVVSTPYGSKTVTKTTVTGRGQIYLLEKLKSND